MDKLVCPCFVGEGVFLEEGMEKIKETLKRIESIPRRLYVDARRHLDRLSIPRRSLGRLEDIAQRYAVIKGLKVSPVKKKVIFTFAGDHGVVEEGVSAFPREVTQQMVINFLCGGAGVNVLARHIGAEVVVIDIGVGYDFEPQQGLVIDKVGYGTGNIVRGPAMTYEEGVKSINIGIDLMNKWGEKGVDIVGTGDMGIGNTTPSSAILAVLSGREIEDVTGRGTGIDDEGLKRKISTIRKALDINKPNRDDPIDVLSKVGGYEIGGIAGLIIGAAANKIPVVVDGFISCAGALIALRLEPKIKEYIFTSHISVESGHKVFFDIIGDKPLLDLDMRLGEGTGAALGITLIEAGVKIFLEMATFEDAGVTEGRY